ncbi:hypothetical protein DJ564_01385 [Pseudomonas sp. 31-12]|nr:hypothetical protein DJ564_01385 [Pseudomonas sp. 31-12]
MVFGPPLSGKNIDDAQRIQKSITTLSQDELNLSVDDSKSNMAYLDIDSIEDEKILEKATAVFRAGIPVLLKMKNHTPELAKKVSTVFGISGSFDYALFHRLNNSNIDVYRLEGYDDENIMEVAWLRVKELNLKSDPPEDQFIGMPKLTYNINVQSPSREMTSVVNIDIIRSAQRSQDKKFVSIKTAPTTMRSAKNGITIGGFDPGGSGQNLWGAYLPHAYRFTHQLTAQQIAPVLVASAPSSDSRTEFSFTETKTTGLSIGGTLGGEFGGTKADNIAYAAKSPFNVNFGLNYAHTKMMSYNFKDYSLLAAQNGSSVTWTAPIDTKLRGALIKQLTSTTPILSEDKMTPMMRSASLESYTLWELPGTYTGLATVSVGGGYDLDRTEWWWERTEVKSQQNTDIYNSEEKYELDMSNPFLTREMTVLIRSADSTGKCISGSANSSTTLESCVASDAQQLWGLDSESRYVNRATQQCLSVRETDGALITNSCALDNRQQWEWQADRLHSLYNREWRLYAENSQLKIIPDSSMHFQNTPKNVFNPLNIPWASYPLAPSFQDVMPNHLGPSPQISPEWVDRYQGVDTRQRWRIEILRDGI